MSGITWLLFGINRPTLSVTVRDNLQAVKWDYKCLFEPDFPIQVKYARLVTEFCFGSPKLPSPPPAPVQGAGGMPKKSCLDI
jgi:hypothetical protein